MEKKNLIENETEKTLQVLNGIKKADVNPYLFNKILNGINEPERESRKFNFRLAFVTVIICFFANLATLFSIQSNNIYDGAVVSAVTNASDSVRQAQINSLASEYSSTNNFYFY
ncbi:MAG: hypothetical protein HY959_05485 [Ignavibacteriae bacterium]|nr:hypothetical protein [Ignavibacteriota bacterium]